MANPYAAGASAGTIMANVKGDIGNDNNDNPQGRLDETGLATAEVTRRLLAYTRPHRVSLIASFVASAVSVVLQLYVPIVIGRAIDCMVSAGDVDFATLVALLQELALVVVGAAVTQWLSGYCTNRLTYETVRDLRIDAFSRFRDLPQIVSALLQVAFYVTPILFHGGMLSGKHKWIVEFNPLAYLIDIVRQPLVGEVPPPFTWGLTIGMAVFGWLLALGMTGRYHRRIPYWV